MKRYRVGVIGTGKIAEEHLSFLASSPRTEPIAVCDLSPSMADYAASRYGVQKALTDYREMLAMDLDVVHVLTPPHTHVRIITDSLGAGAHVIAEKPIAPTRAEFEILWSAATEAGLHLVEDHNYRFNEPVLELERRVKAGELGDVSDIEVRMALGIRGGGRYADENLPHPSHRMPAGVLHEFISHLCYLSLRFLPGPPFDNVMALWSNHGGGDLFRYDDLDALVVSQGVHARIRFTCHARPDCFEIAVRGTEGTARTDLFQPHMTLAIGRPGPDALGGVINQYCAGRSLKKAARRNFADKVMQRTPYEGLQTFLGKTYAAIDEGGVMPVGYDDIDRTLRLIDALEDCAR